jgi:transposase
MGGEIEGIRQIIVEELEKLLLRFDRLEKALAHKIVKESYTTEEVAERWGRSSWTVRQWCNKGLIRGKKVRGRGRQGEWRIPHEEFVRFENEGLLPITQTMP